MICGIFTIENEWIFDIQESCFDSIENSFPFLKKEPYSSACFRLSLKKNEP